MKHLSNVVAVLYLLPLSLGACVVEEGLELGGAEQALDRAAVVGETIRDFPRGSKVVMDPLYEQELVANQAWSGAIAAGTPTIIYMNHRGGAFSPGQNDAGTNRSTLVPGTVSFPAANLSTTEWNQVMSCVTQQFSRFNVQITDVDPGNVPHYESVVSGSPGLLGMPNGVGGVSPFTSGCTVIPNSIVFTFTDVLPKDPQIICEVAAQEIAHSFGLDHEFLCSDPMTYLSGCGAKAFQDVAAPCGEGVARTCAQPNQYDCGYAQQNSVQLLTERLGLYEGEPVQLATITSPLDGADVGQGFEVSVEVQLAQRVELRIDGIAEASIGTGPFLFSTPEDLALGTHVVEIVATSGANTTNDSISINVIGGADDSNDGGDGDGDGDGDIDGDGARPPQVVGGCSAGGGGVGDGALLLLLGLAIFVMRRRLD